MFYPILAQTSAHLKHIPGQELTAHHPENQCPRSTNLAPPAYDQEDTDLGFLDVQCSRWVQPDVLHLQGSRASQMQARQGEKREGHAFPVGVGVGGSSRDRCECF